jgi:sterol desaturase/sphingolipid hydroxylase (fatty acid hydroxylase superfamily)
MEIARTLRQNSVPSATRASCMFTPAAAVRGSRLRSRGGSMQLSKFSYYADFVVYPALITVLAAAGLWHSGWTALGEWLLAALVGAAGWTLLEYWLHRVAFHRIGPFVRMHALHHAAPLALIGAPTWLSATILVSAVFLPLWWSTPLIVASGLSAGLMTGYLWYVTVHHVVHHREPRLLAVHAAGLRRRHMVHHYAHRRGNFGVTTAFWDSVFRTTLTPRALDLETPCTRMARLAD